MLEIIFFGLMQGLLEWLPISSQGNLALIMTAFFHLTPETAVNLSIFLHSGTVLSAVIYFRKELTEIIKGTKNYFIDLISVLKKKQKLTEILFNESNSLISFLLISTFLTGLIGFPIYKLIKEMNLQGELFFALIALALIATGLLQKFSEKKTIELKKLNLTDAIILGLMQGLAVIPGISRSGTTISGFLLRNYSPEQALKYSFLMSIPAIISAEIGLSLIEGLPKISFFDALIGLTSSFVFGLIGIHLFLDLSKKIKFWKFCIAIGLISLLPLVFLI
ncbi:MAG: undecaprenyl-diphosphate phosphatase [Candidatus Diapherotrites archaeon]|nr:undecaprenyl-diphosphate phosphatase [Candidatus Diapherotrites archaeon]